MLFSKSLIVCFAVITSWFLILTQKYLRAVASGFLRMNIWMAIITATAFVKMGVPSVRYGFLLALFAVVHCTLSIWFPSSYWHIPATITWYMPISADSLDYKYAYLSVQPDEKYFAIDKYQWKTLSNGHMKQTIENERLVRFGINTIEKNGGLHIGMLARDVENNMEAIQNNVEAISMFLSHVTVTIFENDSSDNTRHLFRQWQETNIDKKHSKIAVHLLECPGTKDCKLNLAHRYGNVNSKLEKMATFRNIVKDYILKNVSNGKGWMAVVDSDLNAHWSPLGLFAAIGRNPGNAIASRGLMIMPGTLGTLALPYDFMAFQPRHDSFRIINWIHTMYRKAMEAGKLVLLADVLSPFKIIMVTILEHDGIPKRMQSAFNGISIYPLYQIDQLNATYSAGRGYDCEHLAFSSNFNDIIVDPVWTTKLIPESPGGPSGYRAFVLYMKAMQKAIFWPASMLTVTLHAASHAFVHASLTLFIKTTST